MEKVQKLPALNSSLDVSASPYLKSLRVLTRPGIKQQGLLIAGNRHMRCALGRSGMGIMKREGDGKTPVGNFRLLKVYANGKQFKPVHNGFPTELIKACDGWCDAVGDRNYNQEVKLPYHASHEVLARNDHLYDVFIVLDFNISHRMTRGGSAIFFHLAHDDYRPTEGCVAISADDMQWLLPRISRDTVMQIG